MEDVLDQYEKPLDPAEPVICLDEQPYQLLDDTRPSHRAGPGKAAKQDYEYRRCGTCSVFLAVEPRAGKRFVRARRQRTRVTLHGCRDWPNGIRTPAYSFGARQPHTDHPESLIETFGERSAKRLLKRIVWQYTPSTPVG